MNLDIFITQYTRLYRTAKELGATGLTDIDTILCQNLDLQTAAHYLQKLNDFPNVDIDPSIDVDNLKKRMKMLTENQFRRISK